MVPLFTSSNSSSPNVNEAVALTSVVVPHPVLSKAPPLNGPNPAGIPMGAFPDSTTNSTYSLFAAENPSPKPVPTNSLGVDVATIAAVTVTAISAAASSLQQAPPPEVAPVRANVMLTGLHV